MQNRMTEFSQPQGRNCTVFWKVLGVIDFMTGACGLMKA